MSTVPENQPTKAVVEFDVDQLIALSSLLKLAPPITTVRNMRALLPDTLQQPYLDNLIYSMLSLDGR